jgi:hypothetical protein
MEEFGRLSYYSPHCTFLMSLTGSSAIILQTRLDGHGMTLLDSPPVHGS